MCKVCKAAEQDLVNAALGGMFTNPADSPNWRLKRNELADLVGVPPEVVEQAYKRGPLELANFVNRMIMEPRNE